MCMRLALHVPRQIESVIVFIVNLSDEPMGELLGAQSKYGELDVARLPRAEQVVGRGDVEQHFVRNLLELSVRMDVPIS